MWISIEDFPLDVSIKSRRPEALYDINDDSDVDVLEKFFSSIPEPQPKEKGN